MDPTDGDRLLDAILLHVAFDGWSEPALAAAAGDLGLDPAAIRLLAPLGAAGLAAEHHRRGDRRMTAALAAADLSSLRFRDRIAHAVRLRLESEDREIVRRGAAHFALPRNAAEGARLIWGTADAIWTALGDSSQDVNWYTKRLTLAGVYSATVLYWLGDDSTGSAESWAFLDRRIDDVMRIEGAKAALRKAPLIGRLVDNPLNPLSRIRAPRSDAGRWPGHGSAPRTEPQQGASVGPEAGP